MTKTKIHLISKYDSHQTLCGKPIYEHDTQQITKSRLNVTCKNCRTAIDLQENKDEMKYKVKRYLLGHIQNQMNLDNYF